MFFDAETMWSSNNGNNFQGDGIYMNAVAETFSLGQSLWFDDGDGFLGDLTVSGDITNPGGDYLINEDGMRMEATEQTVLVPERALTFYDGNDLIGGMYARTDDNSLWLQSEPGSNIKLTARGGDYVSVEFGMFKLPNYTDITRPSNPEPGAMIYNSDYEGVQVAGETGNWINL